ncbi:MAG: asparaginase domain-containing protein, partial [Candidatus Nanoarchaeia archaeon]
KAVHDEIKKGVDGIIVGSGTDNLAVAAAGITFMVQNSPVPILFVGSQRSSDRGSSDAGMNLISAANFIAQSDFAGVGICMHHTSEDKTCAILPPTKTYKLHSSRRDAFRAVDAIPYALVSYPSGEVEYLTKDYAVKSGQEPKVSAAMEDKVGYLRSHLNMFKEEVTAFKGFKGLVIEGTGMGHMPGYSPNPECEPNKAVFDAVEDLINDGTVVVMCTQTIYGRVNMNVYDRGRDLQRIGIVSAEDTLANTALVKLSWLLAHHKPGDVKDLMSRNMVGEISARTLYEK